MSSPILTGKDLIALGFPPGPALGAALEEARARDLQGAALADFVAARKPAPQLPLQAAPAPFALHLEADTAEEAANLAAVTAAMAALMRTPTLRAGAVMPDACPSGPGATIPVGGVAVAEGAIHPGMHSADICCSVMLSGWDGVPPAEVLEAAHRVTHFGPGGRAEGDRFALPADLAAAFRANPFLDAPAMLAAAEAHLGTQGDGNHFAFAGRSRATGQATLITHHGSRGPGALLFKAGMKVAEQFRKTLSPATDPVNAWIPADCDEGRAYWQALLVIRAWTQLNHELIHAGVAARLCRPVVRRLWNEHNFVFRDGDLFYHAKGATPVAPAFVQGGVQIVPLNMAEPVLLIRAPEGGPPLPLPDGRRLGFAPHGAGRNLSRRAHLRKLGEVTEAEVLAREVAGLDVRFFSGHPDLSELPSAYKSAATLRAQMQRHGLAEVVDEIAPHGSIMAGDWERDAPWRRRLAARARQAG